MVFGWVTIVFALIDAKVGPAALADVHSGHKAIFDKWDPRTLPPVPRHRSTVPVWQLVRRTGRRRARAGLVARGAVEPVPAVWSGLGLPRAGSRPACRLYPSSDIWPALAWWRAASRSGVRAIALVLRPGQQRCWVSPASASCCGPAVPTSSRWRAPTRQPTWHARWSGSIGPSSIGMVVVAVITMTDVIKARVATVAGATAGVGRGKRIDATRIASMTSAAGQHEQARRVVARRPAQRPDDGGADGAAEIAQRVDERDAGGGGRPAEEDRRDGPEHAEQRSLPQLRQREAQHQHPHVVLKRHGQQQAGRSHQRTNGDMPLPLAGAIGVASDKDHTRRAPRQTAGPSAIQWADRCPSRRRAGCAAATGTRRRSLSCSS